MSGHYDVLWKGVLEEVYEDLLRFVFPEAMENLDFKRGVEFLEKELNEMYPEPEKQTNNRVVDKLVKVYLKDGGERWLLVHIEIQGGSDNEFARRMFTYYYRILDRCNRPITAVGIFTGQTGKNMPDRYEDHFMGTHVLYQYNKFCITDYPDEVLAASDNPFAVVLLVAKMRLSKLLAVQTDEGFDSELLKQKLLIVKLLQEKKMFDESKIAVIISFLNNYIRFKKPETNHTFMEQVDNITGKKNTMGYFEQLAEIRVEEVQEKAVKAFLESTEFSDEKIASLVGVTVAFVQRVKSNATQK